MSLAEIKSFYPEFLHNRAEFLLREYLQYKILEILFQSKYASKFVFWVEPASGSYVITDDFLKI
jgi:hypothetical protein